MWGRDNSIHRIDIIKELLAGGERRGQIIRLIVGGAFTCIIIFFLTLITVFIIKKYGIFDKFGGSFELNIIFIALVIYLIIGAILNKIYIFDKYIIYRKSIEKPEKH